MNANENGFNFLRTQWNHMPTFIHQFLRYKYHVEKRLPETWDELADWFSEFDSKRNDIAIELERVFREHMATCIHPIIIPKDLLSKR